jgi:hypothetical protein
MWIYEKIEPPNHPQATGDRGWIFSNSAARVRCIDLLVISFRLTERLSLAARSPDSSEIEQ